MMLADFTVLLTPIFGISALVPERFWLASVIISAVIWGTFFYRVLLWRMECFWNLRSLQNRNPLPANPDNGRHFSSLKGWLYWNFLGIDREQDKRAED